ncbi:hypothetical protein BHE74_00058911 [Ensete ventricosum]|nr:hypothetical protein BHE74_00058911 [Ensete ventricosum]
MRLNRVESFYAFLLHFRSQSSKERRQLAMARPSARAAEHGHTPCRGGRPLLAPIQGRPAVTKVAGAAASKKRLCRPRPGRKGRLAAASSQGAGTSNGGGVDRKGGRPLAGRLPAVSGRRRQRRGDGGGVVKAKRPRATFVKR